MRLVFLGSPDDAVPPLGALLDAGHDVVRVVTRPDVRRGRRGRPEPSPVKRAATERGLTVLTPARARDAVDEVRGSGAELGVVVAYGRILPPELLDAVPLGFVNLHFSLLPRWRGAAPVERAVLAGDRETGVCLMVVEEGLDTGPVYARTVLDVGPEETAGELRARLVAAGAELLAGHLADVGRVEPEPQVGEPTYADKLTVDEFRLDPAVGADDLARRVRAGNPRPGAWVVVGGRRLKVWRAHPVAGSLRPGEIDRRPALGTADGDLVLDEVQPEAKRAMSGTAWVAGARDVRAVDPP